MEDRENTPIFVTGIPAPSGQEAPGNLPSKRPPHTNSHKHTHTVHRSLAWRGWGRKRTGRKDSKLPLQAGSRAAEKVFPPTGDSETSRGGFPAPRELAVAGGSGRPPGREVGRARQRSGSGSAEKRGPRLEGRFRNWTRKERAAASLPDPIGGCTSPVTLVTGVAACQETEGGGGFADLWNDCPLVTFPL